jgi:hypothetical protein
MQIWRALKADCARIERIYDSAEILEEVSNTELVWTNSNGEPMSLKQKSFFQLLKRLKDQS